jgi:tetratricopeptide (TPR) repeat protein
MKDNLRETCVTRFGWPQPVLPSRAEEQGKDCLRKIDPKRLLARGQELIRCGHNAAAIDVLGMVMQTMKGKNYKVIPRVMELRASTLLGIANELEERHHQSLVFKEQALSICQLLFGPMHRKTLRARGNRAKTFWDLGMYQLALDEHQQILLVREELLGPLDKDTLLSLHNTGVALFELGNYSQADWALNACLSRRRTCLGMYHEDTLCTQFWLAKTWTRLSRFAEAWSLLSEMLAALEHDSYTVDGQHRRTLNSFPGICTKDSVLWHFHNLLHILEREMAKEESGRVPASPPSTFKQFQIESWLEAHTAAPSA